MIKTSPALERNLLKNLYPWKVRVMIIFAASMWFIARLPIFFYFLYLPKKSHQRSCAKHLFRSSSVCNALFYLHKDANCKIQYRVKKQGRYLKCLIPGLILQLTILPKWFHNESMMYKWVRCHDKQWWIPRQIQFPTYVFWARKGGIGSVT